MIKLFSTNCPKCKVIEKKLNAKELEYDTITDLDTILKFGEEHNIRSAPILQVDDKVMDFSEANRWLSLGE